MITDISQVTYDNVIQICNKEEYDAIIELIELKPKYMLTTWEQWLNCTPWNIDYILVLHTLSDLITYSISPTNQHNEITLASDFLSQLK